MRLAHLASLAVLVPALTLAGCSGAESGPEFSIPDELRSHAPTETASGYEHAAAPSSYESFSGDHFEISIPQGWELRAEEDTGSSRRFAWAPPEDAGETAIIGVVVDLAAQEVLTESYLLEMGKTVTSTNEVSREMLHWPGAERAVRIIWEELAPGSSDPLRYEQLMVQVEPGLIINVVGAADADDFDDSGVPDGMRSVTVRE
ncbi:MAG: hypothetical protein Q4G67_12045 [Actinomycetia bacterium]|nr:hypothetical protein [Actinomycetes bacterium]